MYFISIRCPCVFISEDYIYRPKAIQPSVSTSACIKNGYSVAPCNRRVQATVTYMYIKSTVCVDYKKKVICRKGVCGLPTSIAALFACAFSISILNFTVFNCNYMFHLICSRTVYTDNVCQGSCLHICKAIYNQW